MEKILSSLAVVMFISGFLVTPVLAYDAGSALPAVTPAAMPDGTLAREASSPKVYYLQGGTKRWIETEAAFLNQDFRWSDILTVSDGNLAAYVSGETITVATPAGLPVTTDLLPDLTTPASTDINYVVQDGRTLLRFTATFWNRGKGAFELDTVVGSTQDDGTIKAAQRIFRTDGSNWDRPVGVLFWHYTHEHFHFDDFGRYRLELVQPAAGTSVAPVSAAQKTTFCMRDDTPMREPTEGPRQPQTYRDCKVDRQGVSVGWSDVYLSTLPEQYFDVTGFPAGLYRLSFDVDPNHHFLESRRDNNVSFTFIQLDPAARTRTVIASASPFARAENFFPDGMLVRAEGDPKVYVMQANKKRHVSSEKVFLSYGYSWSSIIVLPKSIVDVIPVDAPVVEAQTMTN